MKNKKWTINLGLKIIALFFAIILWVIVVNIDDPVVSKEFNNIPVSVTNEEVVTNKGKTYSVVDSTNVVSVTVSAKRSIISEMDESDIIVSADLSQMEVNTWLVPLSVSVQGVQGDYEAETNPKNLQVEIEDITKKVFPISVSTVGSEMEGYVIGTLTTYPKEIEIGGSKSMVEDIQKVVATVDVSGMSKSQTVKAIELNYLDGNGNPMDTSLLSNNLGDSEISVYVQILHTKEVELEFKTKGAPADGYVCSEILCEPKSIEVCGTEDVLKELSVIQIPASEINIAGENSKKTITVDILPYLPEGVELMDSTANNVVVTVKIEKEGTKTIELPVEAIKINNLNSKLSVEIQAEDDLQLLFTGTEEELKVLDLSYAVSIDLSGYSSPGTYDVPVHVETGTGVELMSSPVVKVILTTKEDNQEGQ